MRTVIKNNWYISIIIINNNNNNKNIIDFLYELLANIPLVVIIHVNTS